MNMDRGIRSTSWACWMIVCGAVTAWGADPKPAETPAKPAPAQAGPEAKSAETKPTEIKPTETKPAEAKPAGPLWVDQEQIATKYKRFEEVLMRMAELTAATDPKRAALLRKAVADSKGNMIGLQLDELTKLLKQDQLSKAVSNQGAVEHDLAQLLELLLSEERGERLKSEKERIKEQIRRLKELINKERQIQGQTAGGADQQGLSKNQGKVAEETARLIKDMQGAPSGSQSPGKDGQGKDGEGKDGQGKDGPGKDGAGKDKEGKSKDDNSKGKDGKGKDDKGKDPSGKDGKGKDGEGKDGKGKDGQGQGGGKDGEGQGQGEGKDGKGKDDKGKDKPDSKKNAGDKKNDGDKKNGGDKGDKKDGEKKDAKGQGEGQGQGQGEGQGQGQGQGQGEGEGDGKPQPQQPQDNNPAQERVKAAQQKMEQAKQKLEKAQREGAIEDQEQAIRELEQAKADLEKILRQLREEEQERTLAMLEARFRKMLEWQLAVYEGTRRLDSVPAAKRGRNEEIAAGRLSRDESKILVEADKALEILHEEGSAVAFPEAVEQMREDIDQVVIRLAEAKVDNLTQGIEEDIITALEEMIAALQKAQKDLQQKKPPPPPGQGGQPQDPPLIDMLAELKMIRALQMRVNTRTGRYTRLVQGDEGQTDKPELREALEKLSEREQRIFRTTRDIVTGKNQ
jgi:hypothetical protein